MAAPIDEGDEDTGVSVLPDPDSSEGEPWNIDLSEIQMGEMMASGSYGVVHWGIYQKSKVAVKFVMFPEDSEDQELMRAKRAFKTEVALWHQMAHPNVVQFVGASIRSHPPKWAIVTEFLEGGTLKAHLVRNARKKANLRSIVTMALDISRGMAYMHSKDLIHRDLKSANLLLDRSGTVKVADFGLARVESVESAMTAEAGTIRWMAPEMIDHKPYTHKVDVYSFGIVLWELCTSRWPYEGFTFMQLAYAIVNENHRPSTKDLPPGLAKIMQRCWAKDPAQRPEFSEVVEMLEDVEKMTLSRAGSFGSGRSSGLMKSNSGELEHTGNGATPSRKQVVGNGWTNPNPGARTGSEITVDTKPKGVDGPLQQSSESQWRTVPEPPAEPAGGCSCVVS